MADRGILFSAPMVRALLDGRKSQTRRILKPQPPAIVSGAGVISRSGEGQTDEWSWLSGDQTDIDSVSFEGDFKTGYRPGDRLWVREAWKTSLTYDGFKPRELPQDASILMMADNSVSTKSFRPPWGRLRPGMFMPRWASRLTLTVTDVRVERVQEISEADAIAEGAIYGYGEGANISQRRMFELLWTSLHDKPGERWEDNPWVVVIGFDVRKGNIDG